MVGGGIGGLTAAIGLRRVGWTVTVLERASVLGETGTGWSLAPNAMRALDALGIGGDIRSCSMATEAQGNLLTPSGTTLMRFKAGRDTRLLANHQAELYRVLLGHLPASCVRNHAEVTGIKVAADDVTVTHRTPHGPRQSTAELVVAADGIRSTVRRLLWQRAPEPVFQRHICWRGVTEPGLAGPITGFQTYSSGERFGAHPLRGQRVFWFYTSEQVQPGVRYRDNIAEARRRVHGWHDPIPALLDATRSDEVQCNDIFDLEPLPTYVRGRVALLGDAAHAMTPFLAQGACQAVEDAAVLSSQLAGDVDVPEALARYDRARRPRTQQLAQMARIDPKISLSATLLIYGLSTGFTERRPSALLQRKVARLWDWTPPVLPDPA